MSRFLELFERYIIIVLIVMMLLTVLFGMVELALIFVKELLSPPMFLLNIKEMLDLFGLFLMILIGIELLETVKTYLTEDQLHVEVILLVAIIAVARKVIILDITHLAPITLLGIAGIIISLAVGYFLVKLAQKKEIKT